MHQLFQNLRLARPLAVVDVESTGIFVRKDRVVEIAVITFFPSGDTDRFHRRVNPQMPIPEPAIAIHGITDQDVAACPSFSEIAVPLADFLDGCDLAGFNIKRFDLPLLLAEFARASVTFSLHGRAVIDVLEIYRQRDPRDLATAVRRYLDRDHLGAHGAMADAYATAAVLDAQLHHYPDLPRNVADLHGTFAQVDLARRLQRNERGQLILAFGKYAGSTLDEVARSDPGYLHWLAAQDFLPDFLELVHQALSNG